MLHQRSTLKPRLSRGFTLIEMGIVVFILGLLAALIGPRVMDKMGKAQLSSTKATMASLKAAVNEYFQDIGHVPNKSEGGLDALVKRPRGKVGKKWDGPYIEGSEEVPLDGWGNDFEYNAPPVKKKGIFKYFEIISYGENGEDGEGEPIIMGA